MGVQTAQDAAGANGVLVVALGERGARDLGDGADDALGEVALGGAEGSQVALDVGAEGVVEGGGVAEQEARGLGLSLLHISAPTRPY